MITHYNIAIVSNLLLTPGAHEGQLGLNYRQFHSVAAFIQSIQPAAQTKSTPKFIQSPLFDCVLIDARELSSAEFESITHSDLNLPLLALVDPQRAIPDQLPAPNLFFDLIVEEEFDTLLFYHRVTQAIRSYTKPLCTDSLNHPFVPMFQSVINHASDWIIVKDLNHRFLLVSRAFTQAAGLNHSEIIGKNDLEIGTTEAEVYGDAKTGLKGFWAQDDEVTNTGVAAVEDNRNWRVFSAAPRHKRTMRIPLKNQQGKVYALLVCTHDITEQKQNEKMLRDRTEMLSRVTKEKQNADKHRHIAEQAVNTKNKFLAAASHDLRQPLHAMGLFLDVLESRMSKKEDLDLMKKLKQSTVSLNNLFNSLLDISRLDAGVVEPQADHIPAARLFDNLCEDFRHQAAEKKLHFIGHADDAVLLSDFVLLSRIVRNLVVNAIDNTHEGSVNLTCQRGKDGKHLILITDTGPGIPADEHARIFEEFHQIASEHGHSGKGIGLGLAIVKRLCELLSIEIAIESTLGKGTCFVLRVPSGKPDQVVFETNQQNSLSLQGLTILILDDDVNIREGMEALLQLYGCSTFSAGTLDEVFEKLNESAQEPDLIMADYELGQEATGDKMVETLREELGKQIPAVLITGDTSIEPEKNATRGGLPVLHKPIKPEEMVAVITEVLAENSNSLPIKSR